MGDLLFASRREGIGRFVFASQSKGLSGLDSIDHGSYCDCFGNLCSGSFIYTFEIVAQTIWGFWGNPSLYKLQHRSNGTYLLGREKRSHL